MKTIHSGRTQTVKAPGSEGRLPMKRSMTSVVVLAGLTLAAPLAAQEEQANEDSVRVTPPRLNLDPGAPVNPSGTLNINNGYESTRSDDWVFNFHGTMQFPMTFTVGPRDGRTVAPDQSDTVFHTPAFYPGSNPSQFAWTGAIPKEYLQLAMTYGSPAVKASILLDRDRITDAFVAVDLTEALGQKLKVTVGKFRSRYGIMGEHDLGRYGTPLLAQIDQSAGETAEATFESGDMAFVIEQGFGFAGVDANAPTLASHLHGGLSYARLLQLNLHYIDVRNVSDKKPAAGAKPLPIFPSANLIGAEVRLTAQQYGHFYFGVGKHTFENTDPDQTETTFSLLGAGYRVLNTSGQGIVDQYLGVSPSPSRSAGNGGLLVLGGQYDLSLANLLYPELEGYGPDVFGSVFGMFTQVNSDNALADGKTQSKFGVEATYAMLSWFGAGIRADVVDSYSLNAGRLATDVKDTKFQMISPRLIFKSDWNSNDQLVLQYSRVNYGRGTIANNSQGVPDASVYQDENVITAYGSLWW